MTSSATPTGIEAPAHAGRPARRLPIRECRSTYLRALLVAAVPVVLIGNALWLLASPGFVQLQYALPGMPGEVPGLSARGEHALGPLGARAIRPGGDGVTVLESARLADGTPAFSDAEVRHMGDVRAVVSGSLLLWGVVSAIASASAVAVWRCAGAAGVGQALRRGADVTLAAILLLAVAIALDFGALFASFHGVFFPTGSWRFPADSTLLRLYPKTFWMVGGAAAVAVIVIQAGALRLLLTLKPLK